MARRSLPAFTLPRPPAWLSTDHPGFRAIVTLASLLFMVAQVFSNLPSSALKTALSPAQELFSNLGLYERGWGMFAASNSRTSVSRAELTFRDGSVEHVQYTFLRPGYKLSAWNEVMQDLNVDGTNSPGTQYVNGFLTYHCTKYNRVENPLVRLSLQTQTIQIPSSKKIGEATGEWRTMQTRTCSN